MPWPAVPQRRGREVPIETPRSTRAPAQPRFSIEEVHDDENASGNGHSPVVEEPEEGHTSQSRHHSDMQQPRSRPQPRSGALQLPFPLLFDHSFLGNGILSNAGPFGNMDSLFGNSGAFGGIGSLLSNAGAFGSMGDGSSVVYSSSSFAQQGPDGVQYSKSHSSSYGPQGITEHQMRTKDGRTGLEEMTISRHIGDKGRTVTKWRQADGTQSEEQSLHNITDNEASNFDQQWTSEAERSLPMYRQTRSNALPQASRSNRRPEIGYRS